MLTTVNGWLQKLPPLSFFTSSCLRLRAGQSIAQDEIASFLARNGFRRAQTVREYGEFSIRGGIVDIYPHTDALPVRLDFFGDEIESIKSFDSSVSVQNRRFSMWTFDLPMNSFWMMKPSPISDKAI